MFLNFLPLDDTGAPLSQLDLDARFYAEVADDFVLSGNPGEPCMLEEVRWAVTYLSTPFCQDPDPANDWTAVRVSIYQDIGAQPAGAGGDSNCRIPIGPAGYPIGALPGTHVECFPGGVVCDLTVPMSQVLVTPLETDCLAGPAFEIRAFGLATMCPTLEAGRTYWVGVAAFVSLATCGQVGAVLSESGSGSPAMQIIPELLVKPWTVIDGNADACRPATPPAGTARDIALDVIGILALPDCFWDCGNGDGLVGIADLLALLSQWQQRGTPCDENGDGVDVNDPLALLAHWGPCPP